MAMLLLLLCTLASPLLYNLYFELFIYDLSFKLPQFYYLTMWAYCGLTLSIVFAILAEVFTLISINSLLGRKMRKVFSVSFAGFALPSCFLVACVFWPLFWIDRELIYPRVLDVWLPVGRNIIVHAYPLYCALIVAWVHPGLSCDVNYKRNKLIFIGILFIYVNIMFSRGFIHGQWAYPFYYILIKSSLHFIAFHIFALTITLIVSGLSNTLISILKPTPSLTTGKAENKKTK